MCVSHPLIGLAYPVCIPAWCPGILRQALDPPCKTVGLESGLGLKSSLDIFSVFIWTGLKLFGICTGTCLEFGNWAR